MTQLRLLAGGRTERDTVLHPVARLSHRAGITPVRVPADMWVAPALAAAMKAPRPQRSERALRAVA